MSYYNTKYWFCVIQGENMNFLLNTMMNSANVPGWLQTILNTLTNFINPILIVVSVAGIIYAIVVGIRFAKADDKNEREEAKQKLIYVIVGIVVTIVLIALFYFLKYTIENGDINFSSWWGNY